MNSNHSNDDAPLDALLREWKVEAPLPPRFSEQVWRRIERSEALPAPAVSVAGLLRTWLAVHLPRPALATAYVAMLLAIGAGMGWGQARQESARVTTQLGTRYAQTVDPYLNSR